MKELDLVKEELFLISKDHIECCVKYLSEYLDKEECIDLYNELDRLLIMLNITYDIISAIKDNVKSVNQTDNLHSLYEAERLYKELYGDMASE